MTLPTLKPGLKKLFNMFVLLFAVVLLNGCYGTIHIKEDESGKTEEVDPELAERGRKLYMDYCLDCHGENARGDGDYAERFEPKPTDLIEPGLHITTTGPESIIDFPHYSSEAMRRRIRHGSVDMPRFKEDFSEEEIREIISYLKVLSLNRSKKSE